MEQDKEAIEAIAEFLKTQDPRSGELYNIQYWQEHRLWLGKRILQTLHSLGYVKMVEQKLPPAQYMRDEPYLDPAWVEEAARQDMLSVDSEGCAYRRVRVK